MERLDAWDSQERPEEDLRVRVTTWIMSRIDDPYQGVRREAGFDNLWFGVIPDSANLAGEVVVCSYFVWEREHSVVCSSIASLSAL